ncbi:GTPase IMAP family member 4-like [Balamuthia mandrillaris]
MFSRTRSTANAVQSNATTIDEWVEEQEKELQQRLQALQNVFGDVDKKLMKQSLRKKKNVLGPKDIQQFIQQQQTADQQKRAEKQKLKRRKEIKRRKEEEEARKQEEEQLRQVQEQLMGRFRIIPRAEIESIYEECGRDYEKTVEELLLLVALVEKEQAAKEEEKQTETETTKQKQNAADSEENSGGVRFRFQEEDSENERKVVKQFLLQSMSRSRIAINRTDAVSRKLKEKEESKDKDKVDVSLIESRAEEEEEEDTQAKERTALEAVLKKQFADLPEDTVTTVLTNTNYNKDKAIEELLFRSENMKVKNLVLIFGKYVEEFEVREALVNSDWDVRKATVELNTKMEQRQADKRREEEELNKMKEKEREKELKKIEEERKRKRNEMLKTSMRFVEKGRVEKKKNLGAMFEKRMQEMAEKERLQKEEQQQKQNQNVSAAKKGLAMNLANILTPEMLAGGRPPPRPVRASAPAPQHPHPHPASPLLHSATAVVQGGTGAPEAITTVDTPTTSSGLLFFFILLFHSFIADILQQNEKRTISSWIRFCKCARLEQWGRGAEGRLLVQNDLLMPRRPPKPLSKTKKTERDVLIRVLCQR